MSELISVIIPVYNSEEYLDRCIRSLICQTYVDLELLFINDGSTDDSEKIILKYAEEDSRIRYVSQMNQGISTTRNIGVDLCAGKYLCFVDSDDYVVPEYIEKLWSAVSENDADLAWCDYYHQVGEKINVVELSKERVYLFEYPVLWNKIYKKELFTDNALRFPDGIWYEDLAMIPRLMMSTEKIIYVNEPLYYYYQHSNSITTTFSIKALDMNLVFDVLTSFMNERNDIHFTAEEKEFILAYIVSFHGLCGTTFRMMMSSNCSNKEISEYVSAVSTRLGKYRYNLNLFSSLPKLYKLFYLFTHSLSIGILRIAVRIIKSLGN